MSSKKDNPQVTIDLMGSADLPEILAIEKESFPAPWTVGMFAEEMENKLAQCDGRNEEYSIASGYCRPDTGSSGIK
jgi:inner membrane protein involved in colicin E2 resistance